MRRAVLVSLLVACARHPASAPPAVTPGGPTSAAAGAARMGEGPPLATPGERMQYSLSLQGVDLATYDLGIGEITELAGKPAIVVQGHAKVRGFASFLANIDDRFTSWVDTTTGRSLRFQADEYASGSKANVEHAMVDLASRASDAVTVEFHVNDAPARSESQKVSQAVVWDYNAFLLALRTWEGPPGARLALEVFRSRYLWHVEVTIRGKDKLATELGELPALRIDGRTYKLLRNGQRAANDAEREFTMWISDDDGRVPLEIKAVTDYGDLRMKIIDYQPGTGQRLRP